MRLWVAQASQIPLPLTALGTYFCPCLSYSRNLRLKLPPSAFTSYRRFSLSLISDRLPLPARSLQGHPVKTCHSQLTTEPHVNGRFRP